MSNELEIKNGRRKTFDIEYVEVTEENIPQVAEWAGGSVGGEGKDRWILLLDKQAISASQAKAFVGDIVVHHVELDTYKKFGRKAFNKSFEGTSVVEHSRSSITGKYVSDKDAAASPETTVTEQTELPRDAGLA